MGKNKSKPKLDGQLNLTEEQREAIRREIERVARYIACDKENIQHHYSEIERLKESVRRKEKELEQLSRGV